MSWAHNEKINKGSTRIKDLFSVLIVALCVFIFGVCVECQAYEQVASAILDAEFVVPDSIADTDYDGLPDTWEQQYGLDFLSPGGRGDPNTSYTDNDNDGLNNLEEYRMGTNPIISNSGIAVIVSSLPTRGQQMADFTLRAEVINNSGYDIVKYEWDFDGNGTYDRWNYASLYDREHSLVVYKYTSSGPNVEEETGRKFFIAKVRAINTIGQAGVGRAIIYVDRNYSLSPPTAVPELNFAEITVPTPMDFRGVGLDNTKIARYQWDTNGNGEYDISAIKSGNITRTYDEVINRSFYASLKVTDTDGLSDIGIVGIKTDASRWNGSQYKPRVYLNEYIVRTRAGVPVSLGGYGSPEIGYAKKLEWDFEGDGIYEWSSSIDNNDWTGRADVVYTYGSPGIYRAILKVRTEANVSVTDSVLILVSQNGSAPTASATVTYNGTTGATEINTTIPVKAQFNHSSSSGSIVKYEWDFDGDKNIDYSTQSATDTPTYYYRFPGYCQAILKVTDINGLSDTFYIPVFASYPATYASNIRIPSEGQILAGNAITLVCDVFPDDNNVREVMFQYKRPADAAWTNIGRGSSVLSYVTTWDTTTLVNGARYQLRAIVNQEDSSSFKIASVIVDNHTSTPDIYEYSNGTVIKRVVVDPDRETSVQLHSGIRIDIPANAIADTSNQVVSVEEITTQTAGVGEAFEISITGTNRFLKDITITIPYPDQDNDGVVDGTNINESNLVVKWLNPETNEWEPLYDSVVYAGENLVSAKVNHLSLFGLGSLVSGAGVLAGPGGAIASSSKTISYCFVATAAYGTPTAKDIMVLREFRDRYLMRSEFGRKVVWSYYRYSPPIAKFIETKPALRGLIRLMVKPMVNIAKAKLKNLSLKNKVLEKEGKAR